MVMKSKTENKRLILEPQTDLIAEQIEPLRNFFSTELKTHSGVSHIQLDVTGIETVDSLGVNLIVGLYREAEKAGKSMEIIGAGENFVKIANFFRIPSLFPVKAAED